MPASYFLQLRTAFFVQLRPDSAMKIQTSLLAPSKFLRKGVDLQSKGPNRSSDGRMPVSIAKAPGLTYLFGSLGGMAHKP